MIRDLTGTFRPCPVREKLRFEHFCARGRNAIARGLVEGHLTISYGLRDVVYTCLMCGGCQDSCSLIDWAKIDSPRITRAMREEIHKLGMTPRKILNVQKIKATQRKVDAPPTCQMACPIEQDVSSYIGLIAKGQYATALEVIRQTNPLPSVCGRACTHPCESACRQGEIGHPISIMRLKRFCVDHVANSNVRPISPPNQDGNGSRVAIVGSGPAGLAAANYLVRRGVSVTIFEKNPLPGGMMTHAIPDFTLPTKAVLKDIEAIKALGVEIKTGVEIGKNKKLSELLAEGYAAVLVCVGTWVPVSTAVPGADLDGVWEALDFLHKVKSGVKPNHLGKVIIIGGGKVALDASRTALRLGAEDVSIIYRRTREEMPLEFEDLEAALEEGVCITETSLPTSIVGENGKVRKVVVQKVECIKQDQEGQATVVCVEGSDLEIETDTVILAIGQRPDLAGLSTDITFEINSQGAVVCCIRREFAALCITAAGGFALVTQQQFAHRGDMQWRAASDHLFHAYHALGERSLDIHHLIPLAHGQIHGLAQTVAQHFHQRQRNFPDIHAGVDPVAQLHQLDAELIVSPGGALNKSLFSQRGEYAKGGRGVKPGFRRQYLQAHRVFVSRDDIEQSCHPFDDLYRVGLFFHISYRENDCVLRNYIAGRMLRTNPDLANIVKRRPSQWLRFPTAQQ